MHDAIAIALIFGSILGGGLGITAPPGMLGVGGIRRKRAHVTGRPRILACLRILACPLI
jgi:hypothetical protein